MINNHYKYSLQQQLLISYININNFKTTESIIVSTESVVWYNTRNSEELLLILEGNGGITINGDSTLIKSGDILYIPSNSIRSLANIELEPLKTISIRS